MQRDVALNAFAREGIAVWADEAQTQFRNFIDIFDEVAARWQSGGLTDVSKDMFVEAAEAAGLYSEEMAELAGAQEEFSDMQQRDISQSMAGIYRRNYLIALLQNWSKVQDVLNSQLDASGYSMKENERTMETLAAQYNQLKNAAQQLAVAIGDAGLLIQLKEVVEGTRDAVTWFNELDSATGTLVINFIEVTAALKLLNAVFRMTGISGAASLMSGWAMSSAKATATTRILTSATTGLGVALAGVGRGLLSFFGGPWGLAITAAITGVAYLTNNTKQQAAAQEEANDKLAEYNRLIREGVTKEEVTTIQEETGKMKELVAEYDKLSKIRDAESGKAVMGTTGNLSGKTQAYLDAEEGIKRVNEELAKYGMTADVAKAKIEALNRRIEEATALDYAAAVEQANKSVETKKATDVTADLIQEYLDLTASVKDANDITNLSTAEQARLSEVVGELTNKYPSMVAALDEHGQAMLLDNQGMNDQMTVIKALALIETQEAQARIKAELDKTEAVRIRTKERLEILLEEQKALRDANAPFTATGFNTPAAKTVLQENPALAVLAAPIQKFESEAETMISEEMKRAQATYLAAEKSSGVLEAALENLGKGIITTLPKAEGGGGGYVGDTEKATKSAAAAAASAREQITDLIKLLEREANIQQYVNTQTQRDIDISEARANYYERIGTETEDQLTLMDLYKQKQAGLHTEAESLRIAIGELEDQQKSLDTSTEDGQEAFDQMGQEIEKLKDRVTGLSTEWMQLQIATEDAVAEYIQKAREIEKESALTKLAKEQEDALEDLEDAMNDEIESIEKARDAYEKSSDRKIQRIQDEIDALDLENELLEEQEELAERQAAVEEARLKVSNIAAERNIRRINAETGQWEWAVNETALAEAKSDLEDAEKELADTKAEIETNAQKRDLEEQIDYLEEKQEDRLEAYAEELEKAKKHWEKKIDREKENQEKETAIQEAYWTNLLSTEQVNLDTISEITQKGLSEALEYWEDYYSRVRDIQNDISSGGSGDSGSSSGGGGSTTEYFPTGGSYTESYDIGGPIYADQLAMVHEREYVLNADTVKAAGGFAGVEKLVAAIKMPNFDSLRAASAAAVQPVSGPTYNSSSSKVDRSLNLLGNIALPNVRNSGAFVRELKRLAQ